MVACAFAGVHADVHAFARARARKFVRALAFVRVHAFVFACRRENVGVTGSE